MSEYGAETNPDRYEAWEIARKMKFIDDPVVQYDRFPLDDSETVHKFCCVRDKSNVVIRRNNPE